jgi:hypothetical protein
VAIELTIEVTPASARITKTLGERNLLGIAGAALSKCNLRITM